VRGVEGRLGGEGGVCGCVGAWAGETHRVEMNKSVVICTHEHNVHLAVVVDQQLSPRQSPPPAAVSIRIHLDAKPNDEAWPHASSVELDSP
jgi:hypothetical protein